MPRSRATVATLPGKRRTSDGSAPEYQIKVELRGAKPAMWRRLEVPVTLEQVADWQHDILVEKVLDQDETAGYPRCTAGRRAATPEECGGIWGYADLVEILADPAHPENEDKLEWLGLDDAAQFYPTGFDAETVTYALSRLR